MNKLFMKVATLSIGLAMAIGVGVAVGSKETKLAQATSINTTPVTSITAGKQYVIGFASSGTSFLGAKASNSWGTVVALNSAYVFTAESITNGFALKSANGYLSPRTGGSNGFWAYSDSQPSTPIILLNGIVATYSTEYPLRKGDSGFRWYSKASTTGSASALYELATTYTVTYNKNTTDAVSNMPENPSVPAGSYTLDTASTPTRAGYSFGGWSTTSGADNSGNKVTSITVPDTTTVYAIWNVAKTPVSLALSGTYTTQFAKNSTFSHEGVVVTVTYANEGGTADVSDYATFSSPDMTTAGQKTITVSYTENNTPVSTTYTITVLPEVNSISLNKNSTTINLGKSETLTATVSADTGADTTVTWTTSDNTIATVSGGVVTASASKIGIVTITATAGSKSATCTVTVNDPNAVTDYLTTGTFGNPGSSNTYADFTNKSATSDAKYAGNSGGGSAYIQLRSNNSNSGVVTTSSGGTLKTVSITFNSSTQSGRTVKIYAKDSAYTQATDLYGDNSGTNVTDLSYDGTNKTVSYTFEDDYTFIGLRSSSGALYLDSISILWGIKSADDPTIEITSGTEGVMSGKLGDIDSVEYDVDYKEMTPGDYSISWALTDNDTILDFDNGDFEFVALGADATITVQLKKGNSVVDSDSVTARVLTPTVAIKALSGESVVANSLLVEKEDEGQLGYDVTNEPDSLVTYEWTSSDDGTYFIFDDTDGTYYANENTPDNTPVELTLTMKYDGTVVATNTIEITVDTITGLIDSGRYYILTSDGDYGINAQSYDSAPTAIDMSSNSAASLIPFDIRLVADDTYTISTTVGNDTYYLYCNTTAASGSNNNLRTKDDPANWFIENGSKSGSIVSGNMYTKPGTVNRYLSIYGSQDWRCYINTDTADIQLIPEGYYADQIASAIMSNEQGKTLCDGGSTAPSTTLWNSIASITNIENELAILRGTDAAAKDEHGDTPTGTTREKAVARYDEIMVRYNTKAVTTYADFLGRIEAKNLPIRNSANALSVLTESSGATLIIVVASIVSLTAIGGYFLFKKKKQN